MGHQWGGYGLHLGQTEPFPNNPHMAERTLAQKLGLKPGLMACVINAPPNYLDLVADAEVELHDKLQPSADFIQAFARGTAELWELMHAGKHCMTIHGALWISWPKKASGVVSPLSFRVVRKCGHKAGLVDVKVCSVDAVWSALKFVYRKRDRALAARRLSMSSVGLGKVETDRRGVIST